MAMYVHCHAHRLNLALVDSVKSVHAAAKILSLLRNCCVCLTVVCACTLARDTA